MKKSFSFLIILLMSTLSTFGQVCSGNLGENIFESGDFGEGVANVLQSDPNIAPGYIYTTQMPPNDGEYTISNNIANWPGSFNWLQISDNSPDPNGYMMIVNASYEPGLFYIQEVDNLCENTLYEFSANIYNLIRPGGNAIKPNVSFLIDGVIQYSTGDIPENDSWNNYGFSFSTADGQTSVTLSLQNNAPGGGGNDLALDNISFRPCGDEALILPMEIANICEDGSPIELNATVNGSIYSNPVFQWQQSFDEGNNWENIPGENGMNFIHTNLNAGSYFYRYLLADGVANLLNSNCRVVSNVKIVEVIPKFNFITDTLCQGLTLEFQNDDIGQTGIYTDSLLNVLGCDSIVTLDLTIVPDPGITADFYSVDPTCLNLSNGEIEIVNIYNGVTPYTISVNDEIINTELLTDLALGNYNINISDRYGCSHSENINLATPNPFLLDIGDDQIINLGEKVSVFVNSNQNIIDYYWEPDYVIDCQPDCSQLYWAPPESTVVRLTAEDEFGCVASDSIFVRVEKVRKIYIPNAFSPNDDGINDYFTIFGAEPNITQVNHLIIFDRWGGVVFENRDFSPNDGAQGWDGRWTGKKVNAGVYVFIAQVKYLDGEVIQYEGSLVVVN